MLTSIAGSFRRPGMSEAAIYAALKVVNIQRCKPPLDEAEIQIIARSVGSYPLDPAAVSAIVAPRRRGARRIPAGRRRSC